MRPFILRGRLRTAGVFFGLARWASAAAMPSRISVSRFLCFSTRTGLCLGGSGTNPKIRLGARSIASQILLPRYLYRSCIVIGQYVAKCQCFATEGACFICMFVAESKNPWDFFMPTVYDRVCFCWRYLTQSLQNIGPIDRCRFKKIVAVPPDTSPPPTCVKGRIRKWALR